METTLGNPLKYVSRRRRRHWEMLLHHFDLLPAWKCCIFCLHNLLLWAASHIDKPRFAHTRSLPVAPRSKAYQLSWWEPARPLRCTKSVRKPAKTAGESRLFVPKTPSKDYGLALSIVSASILLPKTPKHREDTFSLVVDTDPNQRKSNRSDPLPFFFEFSTCPLLTHWEVPLSIWENSSFLLLVV